jgi:uncharacterized protein (DUF362 family)
MTNCSSQTVALVRCSGYGQADLAACIDSVAGNLALPSTLTGSTVLLKPNLISSRGPALACTNPHFIATVASWFLDHGAKVRIGDSPAFGTTSSVMARQGMTEALRGMDITPVHFSTPVTRSLAGGLTIQVAAEALECDLFVNLPKLKAHNQMYVTAAVKNIFGIVVGIRKAMLHMRHGGTHREFAEILLGLPGLLPQHCSILDGVEVMHRSGPLDGDPLALRCIGGSRSPVALDTSLLDLLELPKAGSPLWKAADVAGYPGSSSENIRYPLSVPRDFWGSGFLAPEVLNPVRFNPLRFLISGIRRLRLAIHA